MPDGMDFAAIAAAIETPYSCSIQWTSGIVRVHPGPDGDWRMRNGRRSPYVWACPITATIEQEAFLNGFVEKLTPDMFDAIRKKVLLDEVLYAMWQRERKNGSEAKIVWDVAGNERIFRPRYQRDARPAAPGDWG